ncbi:Protein bli-3 [Serendipita indica DSM 11827]|uniref:Related to blue-light-inducible Bli-3 protein n=1 Tax=Serendipita indica (strain DSM 11827) TaxID=1109443 RepID=G4TAI8_SERID|nr:Protein bli-3 [Serendipita indica DSM 11827]CCA68313.1 related to blue-light-inducible Bli-3 protein [Serendipita indica DSM 11827]
MTSQAKDFLDPYTAAAENDEITPQKKIDGLYEIIKATHMCMLVTRAPDGHLHSRCMTASSTEGLQFLFLANNVSYKFEEISADSHVNLSFVDTKTTNWASVAGTASVSRDPELIKKLWSPYVAGYFSDLGDGVHKGDANDPRVSIIKVVPTEIRYWVATSGAVGRAMEHAKGAITGKLTAPGEIRTITPEELQLVFGLNKQA